MKKHLELLRRVAVACAVGLIIGAVYQMGQPAWSTIKMLRVAGLYLLAMFGVELLAHLIQYARGFKGKIGNKQQKAQEAQDIND